MSLRVRMYRVGLGDCFLVSLLRGEDALFNLMIDCGVILGTPDAKDRIELAVRNIIADTSGYVDVLVVTHEHYDHVSGFKLQDELFAKGGKRAQGKLGCGEVWFGWTEEPGDADAEALQETRRKRAAALAGLAARLDALGAADRAVGTQDALRFFGVGKDGKGLGDTAAAMKNAASYAPAERVRYWRPGDVWQDDKKAPGLRIYVLGPPLRKDYFSKRVSSTETYHFGLDDFEEALGWLGVTPGYPADYDAYAPFDPSWCHRLSKIESGTDAGELADFLRERYFVRTDALQSEDNAWRRIDDDWLGGAESLGLALDNSTNNTSLVFAIELVASGKVLLFAADAQVGNWLSWQELKWSGPGLPKNAADLLKRTIFYKVGHHGSHNATLKEKGVEMMPEEGLVAFVPVDHEMALKKRWAEMPLPSLLDALRERCGDYLIRMDEPLPAGTKDLRAGPDAPPLGKLYYEWSVNL